MRTVSVLLLGWALACGAVLAETPHPLSWVAGSSIVALVTERAGVASGLAHDHVVSAPLAKVELRFDPAAPLQTTLTLDFAVTELTVDDPALRARWNGRLEQLGATESELEPLKESAIKKIRKAMLGKKQLDAETHPRIQAAIQSIRKERRTVGSETFDHVATITLTIQGKTVESEMPASAIVDAGSVTFEGLSEFNFSDFGIKPYSAMLGAVRNEDRFFVFVALNAPIPGDPEE